MIEVIPVGGLGNRIRAIASATALADAFQTPLLITWNINHELNCTFHDLFAVNKDVKIQNNSIDALTRITRLQRQIRSGMKKTFVSKSWIHEKIAEGWPSSRFKEHFEGFRNTFLIIETDSRFYPTDFNSYRYLQINDSLKEVVNSIKLKFSEHVIGVHIRRSDNKVSIEKSPTSLFIEAMRSEIVKQSDTSFFLSTDSMKDESILKREFGNRIMTYSTEKKRNTKVGMMQAAVDLYCLASTNKILGSYWSSFSEVASELGSAPLVMVQKKLGNE